MVQKAASVSVSVKTEHLKHHSQAKQNKFAFAYHITITNHHEQQLQLMSRHWVITDGNGKVTEVEGDGVVGEQPLIEPKQSYHYSSGALLDTPVGTMQGHYHMKNLEGDTIKASIPLFTLAKPNSIN